MTNTAVAKITDLAVGKMKVIELSGKKLLLYHLDDGFYATQTNCTHVMAPLARGKIVEDCQVQCPLHRARFDIRSGEVVEWANFPPGVQLINLVRKEKALKTFPVRVEGDSIFVDVS